MNGERCRFYNSCPIVQPQGFTCLHDWEASSGNSGNPYCGKFRELMELKFQEEWR